MKARKDVSRSWSRVFTLIELLVTIVIISILAAILLPALNRARQMAIQANCTNSLGQVMKFIAIYAGNYNDYVPTSIAGSQRWSTILRNGVGVEETASFLRCPSVDVAATPFEETYGMTQVALGASPTFCRIDRPFYRHLPNKTITPSRYPMLADSLWTTDTRFRQTYYTAWSGFNQNNSTNRYFHLRHLEKVNIATTAGDVQSYSSENAQEYFDWGAASQTYLLTYFLRKDGVAQ